MFDVDGAEAMDRWMPLSVLQHAASSPILPPALRIRVASSAWLRAVLLGDQSAARNLAPVAGRACPRA